MEGWQERGRDSTKTDEIYGSEIRETDESWSSPRSTVVPLLILTVWHFQILSLGSIFLIHVGGRYYAFSMRCLKVPCAAAMPSSYFLIATNLQQVVHIQ